MDVALILALIYVVRWSMINKVQVLRSTSKNLVLFVIEPHLIQLYIFSEEFGNPDGLPTYGI